MPYRKRELIGDVEIVTDGVTVWVNGSNGFCLGRFGRTGIDVHHKPATGYQKECLYCTHEDVTKKDWATFQNEMFRHHDVNVPDSFMPLRFKD